jgi:voltage-gated potassium channel
MKSQGRVGRRLGAQVARHPLATLLIVLVSLFLVSIAVLWLAEPEVKTLSQALLMVLPPFLGQVLENYEMPVSIVVVWFVGLVASIGSLAIVTALIVNRFLMICLRGGRMTKRTSESGHVVICGWNGQGEGVVKELLDSGEAHGIVILARAERCPVATDFVEFVCGDPTQDVDLRRAGVDRADSVIVLTDFSSNPNEADARALLIALAVEILNPSVHSCVQILNSSNSRHFERAGVDELICLDQIGGNLAVASALNHGVSLLVSELLTFNSGSEFYRVTGRTVDNLIGMSFAEAAAVLMERKMILLGVETHGTPAVREALTRDVLHDVRAEGNGDRVVVVNPQGEYRIAASDALFCVAESV